MQFILDLARTLNVDPRGCFRQFFSKIKVCVLLKKKCHHHGASSFCLCVQEDLVSGLSLCPCQTVDKPYQDAFDHELEMLKERVRSCAQTRMENAMKELEEEERQKRLGPGGLDPVEVYESLPEVSHARRHTLEPISEQ